MGEFTLITISIAFGSDSDLPKVTKLRLEFFALELNAALTFSSVQLWNVFGVLGIFSIYMSFCFTKVIN